MTDKIVYQPDYQGRVRENMASPAILIERLVGILKAQAAGVQLVEDDMYALATSLYFDTATDWGLATWGLILDETRGTLTEEEYQRILRAKVAAVWSDGSVASLYRMLRAAMPEVDIVIDEIAPCAFNVTLTTTSYFTSEFTARLRELLNIAKPAGIEGGGVQATYTSFAFAGGPDGLGFDLGTFAGTF